MILGEIFDMFFPTVRRLPLNEITVVKARLVTSANLFVRCTPQRLRQKGLTWSVIEEMLESDDWSNIRNEERNNLTRLLHDNYPQRFIEIGRIANAIDYHWKRPIERAIKHGMAAQQMPPWILKHAYWDISMALMVTEYADVYHGTFFTDLLAIYLEGGFPYGWEGSYPEGRLLVV